MGQIIVTSLPDADAQHSSYETFGSFGELLKYLRRNARLTQADLAIAVGYSREQITKLESGRRLPDLVTVRALLVPALGLEARSNLATYLLKLAEIAHARKAATAGTALTGTSSVSEHTNLPIALTRFVGREPQIAEVKRLVMHTRLLALTGAGGVGKTRLALQAAAGLLHSFADGVWLVELASVSDPLLVPHAVADALSLSTATARPVAELLADFLRDKNLLLILDNCEHLLVACARLAEGWLRIAPQLHILATSRESLGLLSATALQVPSLTLPVASPNTSVSVDDALQAEAVQLFVDRATMIRPSWSITGANVAAVVAICRRLDGVPLAIELAATRLQAMSARQIAERIGDRFRLLTGGNNAALPRHQTLRAMVDWSYDLLSDPERNLLLRLSVFAGGWTLESAEWIGGSVAIELLMHLIDKSLVLVDHRGRTVRYRMLETISQYGREKLAEAAEILAAHRTHLDWCRQLVRQAAPFLPGSQQILWYEQIESEYENVQAALDWAILHDSDAAVEMVAGLWHLWFWRGYWQEGIDRARRVFAAAETLETPAGACALVGAANLAGRAGDYTSSQIWLAQGSTVAEALGVTEAQFWAKIALSMEVGNHRQASILLETALQLARADGNAWRAADVLCLLGDRARADREYARATAFYEESIASFRQLGSRDMIPWPLGNLGRVAFETGDYLGARAAFAESVEQHRALGNRPGTADWLLQLALAQLYCGDYVAAQAALSECLPVCHALVTPRRSPTAW